MVQAFSVAFNARTHLRECSHCCETDVYMQNKSEVHVLAWFLCLQVHNNAQGPELKDSVDPPKKLR